jgi:undecaprenyl-diphosphatase
MNYILALIQGISEFLPISSSGHLNLFQFIFGYTPSLPLDIFFHLATLISVLFFFKSQIKDFFSKIPYIIVGTIPTILVVLLFKSKIDQIFQEVNFLPYFFLITSLLLFLTKFIQPKNKKLDFKTAFIIGIFQSLAILPGVSRSGATIFAGLLLGLSTLDAFSFSFYLFIPAMIGAVIFDYSAISFTPNFIFPFIACMLIGLFALNILKKSLISKNFWKFSIYTFILAIVLFLFKF